LVTATDFIYVSSNKQQLLHIANVLNSLTLSTLKIEKTISSKPSVLKTPAPHYISEDGILHSDRCENLKSYTTLTGWAL
jgi:hypothetical protein